MLLLSGDVTNLNNWTDIGFPTEKNDFRLMLIMNIKAEL